MINPEKSFTVNDYIEILLRRIWFVVIPFLVVLTGTILYVRYAPKEYKATTLILVTPQKVPEQFVKSTVTSNIEDRLQTISQEIMSRTRLEELISELKLYPESMKYRGKEEIVELMRKNIMIEIPKNEKEKNHFTISYIGKDPSVVAKVTAKLASSFIGENLRVREQQAQGTSEFLSVELQATKGKLESQERALTGFKRQFLGELPEQREANIRVLEQLQNQYQRVSESLRSARDRKVLIQKQLADIEMMIGSVKGRMEVASKEKREETSSISPYPLLFPSPGPSSPAMLESQSRPEGKDPLETQLEKLQAGLKELELRYTDKHPDILLTKKMIKELEARIEKTKLERDAEENRLEKVKKSEKKEALPPTLASQLSASRAETSKDKKEDPIEKQELLRLTLRYKEMENQLVATDMEIERLKEDEAKVNSQIARYRERIENTPTREQAMSDLTRDYQNTREAYSSLLQKTQEAQRSENLERRQKGEQFRIVDPARVPEKPFKPDIPKVLLIGLFLAGGAGLGAAFFREHMDRSFHDPGDVEAALGLRVLANIPRVKEEAAKA
jgi:uncharacterized protein involved in exopolysaccharide biosynthesis